MTPPHTPLIVVIGSLNIDYVTSTPRCPAAGETLIATSLTISPGGKGANQAVGCGKAAFTAPGRQDVEVQMIGAVGKDDIYVERLMMKTLEESGVGRVGIREVDDDQTGTATIIVETQEGKGENRILVVGGANVSGMDDVDEILRRVDNVSGREPDVVVMQGEIPKPAVLQLLKHYNVESKKTKVVFNPAPVFSDGIPADAMDSLEVLVVNETETVLLVRALNAAGVNTVQVTSEEELQDRSMLDRIAQAFHGLNVKTILVTLGAKGVYYSSKTANKSGLVAGTKVDRVVDTTAAGDTFVGYVAANLARHTASGKDDGEFDIEEALKKANSAAAKCVQRPGAMQSIPFGYE